MMSNQFINLIKAVPYIFQTIYFNFHHLPLKQAIFLPIILYKPQFVSTKGKIIIDSSGGGISWYDKTWIIWCFNI